MLAKRVSPTVGGKLRLCPGSSRSGAVSRTVVPPLAELPAQAPMKAVRVSAQAVRLVSQQLWPSPTLVTIREAAGSDRFTTVLAWP